MTTNEVPAAVKVDAKDRAWRTFIQGFAIDVGVAVVLVLAVAFTKIEWTLLYWQGLGLSLSRTILQSGVAYLMRVFVKPHIERLRSGR
jgi:di/tricarboxylate transporter